MSRSTREVLEDHLELARRSETEEDIRRNYAPDVVILTKYGVKRGHDGVRAQREELEDELHGAIFEYEQVLAEGPVGFLVWRAHSGEVRVGDGADSFLVKEGKIVAQTIHYTVREA